MELMGSRVTEVVQLYESLLDRSWSYQLILKNLGPLDLLPLFYFLCKEKRLTLPFVHIIIVEFQFLRFEPGL